MNLDWILARAREPSTYAGIAAVAAGAFGFHLAPGLGAQLTTAAIAVAGAIAVVLKEKPKA